MTLGSKAVSHAVDESGGDDKTYCGYPLLDRHTPWLRTAMPAQATCPECVEERDARRVERALGCSHPPLQIAHIEWCEDCGKLVSG